MIIKRSDGVSFRNVPPLPGATEAFLEPYLDGGRLPGKAVARYVMDRIFLLRSGNTFNNPDALLVLAMDMAQSVTDGYVYRRAVRRFPKPTATGHDVIDLTDFACSLSHSKSSLQGSVFQELCRRTLSHFGVPIRSFDETTDGEHAMKPDGMVTTANKTIALYTKRNPHDKIVADLHPSQTLAKVTIVYPIDGLSQKIAPLIEHVPTYAPQCMITQHRLDKIGVQSISEAVHYLSA